MPQEREKHFLRQLFIVVYQGAGDCLLQFVKSPYLRFCNKKHGSGRSGECTKVLQYVHILAVKESGKYNRKNNTHQITLKRAFYVKRPHR
jgi:hypothetical protein